MILTGKTQKGKNIIQRDGKAWKVIRSSASLECFNGDAGFLIEPIDGDDLVDQSRWIREVNDENFSF